METMDLISLFCGWFLATSKNGVHINTAKGAEFANANCFGCARSMQLLYLFRKKNLNINE